MRRLKSQQLRVRACILDLEQDSLVWMVSTADKHQMSDQGVALMLDQNIVFQDSKNPGGRRRRPCTDVASSMPHIVRI